VRWVLGGGAALLVAAGLGTAQPRSERIVFARAGEIYAVAPDGGSPLRLTHDPAADSFPRLSPDGARIAFVSDRDGNPEIYVMGVDGRGLRRLTANPGRIDTSPAWSPDGTRIAYASGAPSALDLFVMDADGSGKRALAGGPGDDGDPAWSPDGQVAFASNRLGSYDVWVVAADGGAPQQLTTAPGDEREPAWAPGGGRLVFVGNREGNDELYAATVASGLEPARLTADPAPDRQPSWSPDGRRIAFARGDSVYVMGADGSAPIGIATGGQPAWGAFQLPAPKPEPKPAPPKPARPTAAELLPDFDQRAPHGLVVSSSRGRQLLGFASASDNVGRGPMWIVGRRQTRLLPTMTAAQRIRLANGRVRTLANVGVIRYTYSPSHSHWHLLRFMVYELRRAGTLTLVTRDRKSGFCLADHYGHAATRVRGFARPFFLGNCGKRRRDLLFVRQGTSVGYTDRYPAHFHGQNLDVTRVPAGRYWLVHRTNPSNRLRERTYANNAAAVLIRLSRVGGRFGGVTVRVLRVCEHAERC
jgi:dipeptidyl aminopeptidase/acylaminoacyl peptidase